MKEVFSKFILLALVLGNLCFFNSSAKSRVDMTTVKEVADSQKIYYLNATSGDDSNDGLSQASAWKSIKPIKNVTLQPGDQVLFKRGEVFSGRLEISAQGSEELPIVFGVYGEGQERPLLKAPDRSRYAVRIYNSNYVTLEGLEVVNHGSKEMGGRTGVFVECKDFGVSKGIRLNDLFIRDVNGIMTKKPGDGTPGGGSGILISNGNSKGGKISTYDGLTIEYCHIKNCYRNAMIWDGCWDRTNWYTSKNVLVRYNLIEEVPGDGIVPIGCDGAILEYNVFRNGADKFDHDSRREAAAGIWPWSCDNTIIRFNEACGHKAPWDGQGFDADYNCSNTVIEYNYSHDNWGGMVLVCAAGDEAKYDYCWGNIKPIVRYNISIGDGNRPHPARGKMFSPSIHIGGPVEGLNLYRNIVHNKVKAAADIDRTMLVSDDWVGCANNTTIKENIFYAPEESGFDFTNSKNNRVEGNYYLGLYKNYPSQKGILPMASKYEDIVKDCGTEGLMQFMDSVTIAGGVQCRFVNKAKIEAFFEELIPSPEFVAYAEPYYLAKGAVGALPVKETDELLSKKDVQEAKAYVESVADKVVKFDPSQYYRIRNYVRDLNYGNNKRVGYSGYMGNTSHEDWTKEIAEVSCHGASLANANFVWAFEKVGDTDTYKIKNLNTGLYLSATNKSNASKYLTFVEEAEAGIYCLESLKDAMAQYHLACTTGKRSCNQLHASGAGVMNYNTAANDASSWYIVPATELEVALTKAADAYYAPLYLPFDVNCDDQTLKFFGVKTVDPEHQKVTLAEMEGLLSENGGILSGTKENYTLTIKGKALEPDFDNMLLGTNVEKELSNEQTCFVYGTDSEDIAGFYPLKETKIPSNIAYLSLPDNMVTTGFHLSFEDITGVESVVTPLTPEQSVYYDLTGRRVLSPVHGVYIKNGKKVFIK